MNISSDSHQEGPTPPQTGTTLPPQTQGSIKGYITIIAHCIMWKDAKLFNNHGELNVRWWGEQEPGVFLSPPTCNATVGDLQQVERKIPHVDLRHYVEVKYPVRCTKKAVRNYFRDFGALPIVVSLVEKETSAPIKVGETFVTLSKIPMDGTDTKSLKQWFSVHDRNSSETLASVLIEMKLEHQDKEPLEDHVALSRTKLKTRSPKSDTASESVSPKQTGAVEQHHRSPPSAANATDDDSIDHSSFDVSPADAPPQPQRPSTAKPQSNKRPTTTSNAQRGKTGAKSNRPPSAPPGREKTTASKPAGGVLRKPPHHGAKKVSASPHDDPLLSPIVTKIRPQHRESSVPETQQQNIFVAPPQRAASAPRQEKTQSTSPFRMSSYQQTYQVEESSVQTEENIVPSLAAAQTQKTPSPPHHHVNAPPVTHEDEPYLDRILRTAEDLGKGMNEYIKQTRADMYDPKGHALPPDDMYTDDYLNPYHFETIDQHAGLGNDLDDDEFSESVSSTSSLGDDQSDDDEVLPNYPAFPSRHMAPPPIITQAQGFHAPREGSTLAMPRFQSTFQQQQPATSKLRPPPSHGIQVDSSVALSPKKSAPTIRKPTEESTTVSDDSHVDNSFDEDPSSEEGNSQNVSPVRGTKDAVSERISLHESADEADAPNLASPKVAKRASPKQEFCFLVHISWGKLLGRQRSEHFNLSCRLPFVKNNEKKSIFAFHNREPSPLGIFHVYIIDPSEKDFFEQMAKRSFVIELSEAGGNYLGVATLPLKKFYECFTDDLEWKPTNAVYGYNGDIAATNPLTGEDVAEFQVLTAFGTKDQILKLQEVVLPATRVVYELQGKPARQKLSDVQPVENVNVESGKPITTQGNSIPAPRTTSSVPQSGTIPQELSPLTQTKAAPKSREQPPRTSPIAHTTQKPEHFTAVPIRDSTITVDIIQACGLQEAARVARQQIPDLESAYRYGLNSFVTFRVFDDHLYNDESLVQSDFQTEIKGRNFTPNWNYSKSLRFHFNEESYKCLEMGEAEFQIFHHFTRAETARSNNVLLGVAKVPLTPLLLRGAGIRDWFTIYDPSEREAVGSVEIQISLDEATKRTLKLSNDDDAVSLDLSTDSEENDWTFAGVSPRASYYEDVHAKKSVCKVTCLVDEIFIPPDTLLQYTPEYTKQFHPLVQCDYFIAYDHVNSSHVESRLYHAANSVNHLKVQHTSEVKLTCDDTFDKMLQEKTLHFDLYVHIDSRNDDERTIRKEAQLLGTAHVNLAQLYEKRKSEKSKSVWISGTYPLINPHADNLKNGRMRISVSCEVLTDKPSVMDQLHALRMEKDLHESIRTFDVEDEVRETLRSGDISVRSSMRRRAKVTHTPAPLVRDEPAQASRIPEENDAQIPMRPAPKTLDTATRKKVQENLLNMSVSTAQQTNMTTGEEKTPINHLNVHIYSALHLPSVQSKSSLKTTPPSAYVSIITPNYNGDPQSQWKSLVKTPIVSQNNAPTWNFSYRLPIYEDIDKIFLQVFHKYNDGKKEKEILIGDVIVELDLLRYGSPFVESYFLIQNPTSSHQSNASLHVKVEPEKPLASLPYSQVLDSPKSVKLLENDEKEEEESFILHNVRSSHGWTGASPKPLQRMDRGGLQDLSLAGAVFGDVSRGDLDMSCSGNMSRAEIDTETVELRSRLLSCLNDLDTLGAQWKSQT